MAMLTNINYAETKINSDYCLKNREVVEPLLKDFLAKRIYNDYDLLGGLNDEEITLVVKETSKWHYKEIMHLLGCILEDQYKDLVKRGMIIEP